MVCRGRYFHDTPLNTQHGPSHVSGRPGLSPVGGEKGQVPATHPLCSSKVKCVKCSHPADLGDIACDVTDRGIEFDDIGPLPIFQEQVLGLRQI